MTTLDTIKHNIDVRIYGFSPNSEFTIGLMELGLIPGAIVRVVRHAPLGDPIEIDIMGARLVLRRNVASDIIVQEL